MTLRDFICYVSFLCVASKLVFDYVRLKVTREHGFGAAGQCSASVAAGSVTTQLCTVRNDLWRFEWQGVVSVCESDEKVFGVSKRVEKGAVRVSGSSPSITYCRWVSQRI